MQTGGKVKKYKDIWDLTPLFKDDNDLKIKEEIARIEKNTTEFVKKWKNNNAYLNEPQIMATALREYETWEKEHGSGGKQSYYFSLRTSLNQSDTSLKSISNKLEEFETRIRNEVEFFTLRISKIPKEKRQIFLDYPGLENYQHFLEKLFEFGDHLLSESEEKIMNLKQKTSYSNWVRMVSEFLSKEEREVLVGESKKELRNFSELMSLVSHKDKKIRKNAAEAVEDILSKHSDVAEAEFNNILEDKRNDDLIRGFSRPDSERHISDDIETSVVDTLIKSVSGHFDFSKQFYTFKAKLLGQDRLEYYERAVEYGKLDKVYSFEESLDLVHQTFSELDGEFADILQMYRQNGHFDAYPAKGKVSGAFCAHSEINDPTYILLNHTGKLSDVTTIAHEVGHGINNELVKKEQTALNFGTPTSTAEIASTFMEDFVLEKLARDLDEEGKLSLLIMKLDSDVASIFRQTAFYNFELEAHKAFREEGYLPKEKIGSIFSKHMSSYMGPAGKGSENWWIYVSHFRHYFYVYSYVSGLLISKYLQRMVKNDKKSIIKVKKILSAGLSESPKDTLIKAGLDISQVSFWNNGLNEIKDMLEEAQSLAKRLGKI